MELFKKTISIFLVLAILLPHIGIASSFSSATINYSGLRLDFDGVDEVGKSGNDPTGNTNTSGTVNCWAVFDTVLGADGVRWIFAMGGDDTDEAVNFGQNGLVLRRQASVSVTNRMEYIHRIDGSATTNRVVGGTTIVAGTQYMFTFSSSGTATKIYVNGVSETLTAVSGSNTGDWFGDTGTNGTRHYAIGNSWRDGVFSTNYTDGKIDHCSTWSSQLSDAEVTRLYNGGKPIHPSALGLGTNLENFWKLGEDANGTVTTMHDAIGSSSVDNFTMENMENADIVTTSYY